MISADKLSMRLETALGGRDLIVETSHRLPYAIFATSYEGKPGQFGGGEPATKSHGYQTDLLVAERLDAKRWVPRVVVEFQLGKINTHEALHQTHSPLPRHQRSSPFEQRHQTFGPCNP